MTLSTETTTETDSQEFFDDDAALIAGLDELDSTSDGDEDAPSGDPEPSKEDTEGEGEQAAPGAEAEEDAESDEATDKPTDDKPEEAKAPEVDEKLTKRLETIQQAQERSNAQLDEKRAELEKFVADKEAELEPQIAALKEFDALKARVAYDLPSVLSALGVKPENYEEHARMLFAMRPEAMNDPKTRDQAQRAMAARQQTDVLSKLQAEIAEMKAKDAERETLAKKTQAQQAQAQQIATYMAGVTGAASDETPLVKALLTSNPAKAEKALRKHADELYDEYGELPDPADVVKRFEQERIADLKELGIDPTTALAGQSKKKTNDAGEKKSAKTLNSNLGTPTRPRTEPMTEEEIDAELAKELDALDAKSS